ncbi:MAG TPA: hypothetical protein VMG59_00205 [Phycisphaerae bacterium]|nr:hypothetical protein [Phycisphaerae bacterium]
MTCKQKIAAFLALAAALPLAIVQADSSINTPADSGVMVAAPADDVLDYVPANARMVFVMNNLNDLHKKIASLLQTLQIPNRFPSLKSVVAGMGIKQDLDIHGSAALVFLADLKARESILLVPATDANEMLSSLNPVSEQDGIAEIRPYEYAVVTGHYVAVDSDRQPLVDFVKASSQSLYDALSLTDINMIDGSDLGFYINMAAIRDPIENSMDESQENTIQRVQSMRLQQSMINQIVFGYAVQKLFVHEILDDIKTGVAGLSISDDGITLNTDKQYEPNTPPADFVTESRPLGGQAFAGLPQISPSIAFAVNFSGGWAGELFNKWSESLANNPDLQGNVRAQQTVQQWNQIAQLFTLLSKQDEAVQFTPAIQGYSIITTDQPSQAHDLQRKIILKRISSLQSQNRNSGFNMTAELVQDALNVDGVSFDKIIFNMNLNARTFGANQPPAFIAQFIQDILGPDGLTAYSGVVGNNIISGINVSNDQLQSAVETAKNPIDAVDSEPTIIAAQQHVLPDASVIVYAQPSALIETFINSFQTSMGAQAPSAPGGPAEPVGGLICLSEAGSLGRIYLPISELERISADAHQLIPMFIMMKMEDQRTMQQQGGGPPIQPRQ